MSQSCTRKALVSASAMALTGERPGKMGAKENDTS